MPIKTIKNSFNAGELSPILDGRTDLSKYHSGCSELVNATAMPTGGFVKRSGSIFVAKTKIFTEWVTSTLYPVGCVVSKSGVLYYCEEAHTSGTWATDLAAVKWSEIEDVDGDSSKVKLFSFEFNTADSHILEFGTRYMRVYKNHDRIYEAAKNIAGITLSGTNPVSINISTHGYLTGDTIKIETSGIELDNKEYIVIKTDADNFTLYGTNSSNYTAYVSGGTVKKIYEITTPFDSEDIFEIHKAQSADVMFIASENYWPQKLSRLDDDSWTLADCDFERVPFLTENVDSAKTMVFASDAKQAGTHSGANNQATLTDATKTWTTNEFVGRIIYNTTDGSSGTITANDATTITATLSGGSENDWDTSDAYTIGYTGYYFSPGVTGTLTAAGIGNAPFLTSHVGSYWLVKHTREDNTLTATGGGSTVTSSPIVVKGDFTVNATNFSSTGQYEMDIQRKSVNGTWQSFYKTSSAVAYSSTEEEKDVQYRLVLEAGSSIKAKFTAKKQEHYGVVLITGFTSSTVVSCTVVDSIYRTGATGTSSGTTPMWAEGAWSDYRGFPRTVCFYEERLYWAASTYNPQTIWGSRVGVYLDHTVGDADDYAISMTLNANDVSQIQWIAARQSMIVGTASGEFVLSASNPDDPMTANDKKSRPASNFGSTNLQPLVLNNGLFYFQRQGRKLQIMTYEYVENNFKSTDATLLASHILEVNPVCAAVQSIPDSLLWVVREDGTLAAFCYEPSEQVFAAWSRCVTGSLLLSPVDYYESCASIHGDTEDELWTSVKRLITVSSVLKTYRYVEYFSPRLIDTIDECVCVDSAVVGNTGYASQTITYASDTARYGSGIYGNSIYTV